MLNTKEILTTKLSYPQHPIIYIISLSTTIALLALVAHCAEPTSRYGEVLTMYSKYKQELGDIPEISPEEALALSNKEKIVFLDVRSRKERNISTIPHAISLKAFKKNREKYQNKRIIVFCTVGYRSGKVVKKYIQKGFRMENLATGILGWLYAGGTLEKDNTPTRNIHVYGKTWDLAPVEYKTIW